MVSRRKYISIFIIMAALLFLFQSFQVFKEGGSKYDTNEYVQKEAQTAGGGWQLNRMEPGDAGLQDGAFVLLLSAEGSGVSEVAAQWCAYTKRTLVVADRAEDAFGEGMARPELLLIDSGALHLGTDEMLLAGLAQEGVPMVFCNLPEAAVLKEDEALLSLLGIRRVASEAVTVEGLHLFSGFFLGGEMIFAPETPEEEEMLDLELEIPWYITGKGTKTYMAGIWEEDGTEPEEFPAVIWRNCYENAFVFAVCGGYMEDAAGLGILDAIVYELSSYTLYPVVNANSVTVVGYPVLADENAEEIGKLYSRSPEALQRDVIWPGILAMADRFGLRFTFCMTPQYDYTDQTEPKEGTLSFYLRQMRQIGAEAGGMFPYTEAASLNEKLECDRLFRQSEGSGYRYCAWYVGEEITPEAAQVLEGESGEEIRTLVCGGACQPVSYYQEKITLQAVTGSAQRVTYSQLFRKRSLETALGYSNVLLDMRNVIWPQSEEDHWEKASDVISGNLGTYWADTGCFDKTVLSESDQRIRSFLNLDYRAERADETITLYVTGAGEEAWFLLRTHGEDIGEAKGASCEKVEEGVWLLRVFSEKVTLQMKSAEEDL